MVVVFQENRTPDNLFQGLPGADIADHGTDSTGATIPLAPIDLAGIHDLGHSHADFLAMFDGGRMDGADQVRLDCPPGAANGCGPDPSFRYVDPTQVVPYFDLARRYTFGDRMFQSNQGPSFPTHQYLIAGTSAPSASGPLAGYLVAENPVPRGPTGCVEAPANQTVALIDPTGTESVSIAPCLEHRTLIDLLDAVGASWRYYTPTTGSIWTGPAAVSHLRSGPDWARVITPQSQVLVDIANGALPDVAWVIPDAAASDHARGTDGSGPSWVASIVNAIGTSAYWRDTVVFVTWDDWGGWYDHVAPPIHSVYEDGFRVPLIIVSPFARKGHVSHVTHDFGSLLNFIEETFALPSLGVADARADDFADCFDFTQAVAPYVPVPSTLDGAYFVTRGRTVPPGDPDDD